MDLLEIVKNSIELFMKDYWTDNEGYMLSPVNDEVYKRFVSFFVNNFNFKLTSNPVISLCEDGSVNLWLRNSNYRFSANVSDKEVSWYGDDGKNRNKIEREQNFVSKNDLLYGWIGRNFSKSLNNPVHPH